MSIVACYVSYLAISIALTIWVARTLYRSGRIFLLDAFRGNEALADSVNHLLVVGFYLINIGYIALAMMIVGGWKPLGALFASLLFGVIASMQGEFSTLGVPVASQFLLMAPYLATIVVVAGVVGSSRMPAADG